MDITGKPMRGWVMVEPDGVENEGQLKGWVERALKFVRTLPGKSSRGLAMALAFQKTIPILRIFDVEKAKEFYVGFLGFTVDYQHHFGENTPAYIQVSRAGLTLHLSEHYGDACPGAAVHIWMTGLDEFHKEITSKNDKSMRPGIETTFYNARCVSVIDPFGNRIDFNEDLKPATAT